MSPVRIASIPARATALAGSRPPSGRMIPAITAASEESGPSTITREGPNTAYTSSGTMVAYSPVIGGSPAACAYPIPTGTRNAVKTSPATRSLASQLLGYRRKVRTPGTHRPRPAPGGPPVTRPAPLASAIPFPRLVVRGMEAYRLPTAGELRPGEDAAT